MDRGRPQDDDKGDVFAPFGSDKKVVRHEKKLFAEAIQLAGDNAAVDNNDNQEPKYKDGNFHDDVFADFRLDSIVLENDELERIKRQEAQQKHQTQGQTAKTKEKRRIRFPKIMTVSSKNMDNEGSNSPSKIPGDPSGDAAKNQTGNDTLGKRRKLFRGRIDKSTISATTARSLTMTIDEEGEESDQEGFLEVDPEDGTTDDEQKEQKQKQEQEEEVVLQWESAVPEVENIFADFDLDAIVRDYERLSRKINEESPDDLESIDSDDQNVVRNDICGKCFDRFPRVSAIVFRVFLPLWFLVLLATGLGYVLGRFEEFEEYERNDAAMRNRFIVESIPTNDTLTYVSSILAACVDEFIEGKFNITLDGNNTLAQDIDFDVVLNSTLIFSNMDELDPSNNITELIQDLSSFVESCISFGDELLLEVLKLSDSVDSFTDLDFSLTFDWIRCWNTTELGPVNPLNGNSERIKAAGNQRNFYAENWRSSQVHLFETYLNEANCTTSECRRIALGRSISDATGRFDCDVNIGNSAWLWFMVLTTVGYGNTVPVTREGRMLVSCLGWLSVVAFAGLIAVAGQVIGIIVDDLFHKMRLKFLTNDVGGVLISGSFSVLWMLLLAEYTYRWWESRLDDPPSRYDAWWFSYISLLTVGLGDYYIEADFIFLDDLFIFTFIFLAGFTFISTFLEKTSSLCSVFLPTGSGENLKNRLRKTHIVGLKTIKYKEKNEKALDAIGGIVSKMDDDLVDSIEKRAGWTRQKKEILIHLLYQTEQEIDYFTKRGEKYDPPSLSRVNCEENMLIEILDKTRKERKCIEHYRRRGKMVETDDRFDLLDDKAASKR